MKKIFFLLTVAILLIGLSQGVHATGTYIWDPTIPNYNPSAIINPGMINTSNFVFGDFLGLSSTRPSTMFYGDSGVSVNWDEVHDRPIIGDGNTNGDALDGLWVKLFDRAGWWDLGTAAI